MKRMLDDYYERFYHPLHQRHQKMAQQGWRAAKEMAAWKKKLRQNWNNIKLAESEVFDSDNKALKTGEEFYAEVQLQLEGLAAEDIGLEVVFFSRIDEERLKLEFKYELELTRQEGQRAWYHCKLDPELAGVFEYGFRAFPKSEMMPHRQDLPLVKWL